VVAGQRRRDKRWLTGIERPRREAVRAVAAGDQPVARAPGNTARPARRWWCRRGAANAFNVGSYSGRWQPAVRPTSAPNSGEAGSGPCHYPPLQHRARAVPTTPTACVRRRPGSPAATPQPERRAPAMAVVGQPTVDGVEQARGRARPRRAVGRAWAVRPDRDPARAGGETRGSPHSGRRGSSRVAMMSAARSSEWASSCGGRMGW